MAAEIIQIDTQAFSPQEYGSQDINLLTSFDVNTSLSSSSYIELYIYDNNQNILSSDTNFVNYTVINDGQSAGNGGNISEIILDPEQILLDNGYDQGEYITYFNFLNHQIGSDIELLYITEISSDRTEIRLDSTSLTNLDIVEKTTSFIQLRENNPYFLDFYLNFGDNQLSIANNIQLDNTDPNNPTILIKLYDALPEDFDLNSTLWVVTSVEEPRAYKVSFTNLPIEISDTVPLKGPNFNLDLKDQVNNSTLSLSYADLISTSLTSSQNQINSLLEEKEIDINIDYTNFSDFIHFSSAQTRLENFYHKVELLEQYSSSISVLNTTNSSSINVSSSKAIYESKINEIITNFDGWDYYLYYSSGSWAYPKSNTEPPYQLESTTSNTVLTWLGSTNEYSPLYGGLILSASLFDNQNKDNLLFSIPEYLRDDSDNQPYELFIDMVAQHFDNIWIYYKDVTQKYNADNRLESGISKDIVADAIRDFGIKLYQNNFSNEDLYTAFLGLTPEGGLFPFPNITGSLPTPSGFEYVDTLISASNDYLPLDDVNKSLYKRIYHNLPYLLKSKGTLPGLRALITSYGIPDTILRINEYGGKDKSNLNDWDYWQNEFNYAFKTEGNNFISSSWGLNPDWNASDDVPNSLMFRFKTNTLPNSNIPYSQSLVSLYQDPLNKGFQITLKYTGSGYTSGSYDGSIKDPYYQYAELTLTPEPITFPNLSSSIYLPFFDGNWWSVMVNRVGADFTLYVGNKIYEGGDNGTLLGFYQTSSVSSDDTGWTPNYPIYFASSSIINGKSYLSFSGSLQEIRYYTNPINENVFKDYIMNPYSIEGNSLNSGPNEIAFRASLGGELYTESVSIHPKITGSWPLTHSFASDSDFTFSGDPTFVRNEEYFFYDQPAAGIKNAVSDKIRLENDTLPSGDTLSPYRSLAQTTEASASYTPNINLLEVAFSPQDEINDDINSSLGYFNIGNFIGDPAFRSSRLTSYPDLDVLRNSYFEKYTKNYDLVDFIRLIKFFDNSLFKMIKDFVPARTSLASGIIVKQHLLERNRYPQPQVSWEDLDISGTLKPTWNDYEPGTVENFSGGTGGSFEQYNYVGNISQSWYETVQSPLGLVTTLHDDQDEFYNGEFSGSVILVTTQSLNQAYPLENAEFNYSPILYKNSFYGVNDTSTTTQAIFLNSLTVPQPGEMLILAPKQNKLTLSSNLLYSNAYIKLHKTDLNGNNNTIPLGQITNLLIKYTSNNTYTDYQVLNISEYPNYYLYEISNQNIDISGSGIDTEIKNYYVSSSKTTTTSFSPFNFPIDSYTAINGNSLGYFNTSSGEYTLANTPNIPLIITASFTVVQSGGGSAGTCSIATNSNGVITYLSSVSFPSSFTGVKTISSSYIGLDGDILVLTTKGGVNASLSQATLLITQSVTPTSSYQDPIILEPYITTPNYYNSDFNAILNNIDNERLSTLYQDVDYSSGILTPTNFDLLVEGTALKAPVQDSNYTTRRHVIPRYEGSKSTSQNLNTWTLGDTGTYGKLPTVESMKTYVAYSDTMGGYPPERMNTSGILIKYLISEDGDLIAPNISPDSLGITQQTFVSGENISLQSLSAGTFAQNPSMAIFRGGTSIEPIMYNQIGHSDNPPMMFTSSIYFTDRNTYSSSSILDYTATLSPSSGSSYYSVSYNGFSGILNDQIIASGNNITTELSNTNKYTVTSNVINENVDLVFDVNLNIIRLTSTTGTVYARVIRNRGGIVTAVSSDFGGYITSFLNLDFTITISNTDLQVGDEFSIAMVAGQSGTYYVNDSTFKISTNPYPTPPLNVTSLFTTSSISGYENYIYTTSSQFIQYLNSSNIYQQDIVGSGFNPITLPISIQRGDEFRFEGDETKTFMVDESYIQPTIVPGLSVLVIKFNRAIANSNIDLNEFLLRRYVDNAGALIVDGFKPSGYDPPYLIKPEYMSEKMEKNIGKYIEDFTNKGLL